MNLLELFLGQIPEAIYFVLFLVFAKKLNEKRLLFGLIVTVDYVLLLTVLPYDWYFHIIFMILLYCILKIFYGNKSQITDIFLILISYVFLVVSSIVAYAISYITLRSLIFATVLNRIIVFTVLLGFNYKLNNLQKLYKNNWNRNSDKKIMKSVTFRSLNLIFLYLFFLFINFGMIYHIML